MYRQSVKRNSVVPVQIISAVNRACLPICIHGMSVALTVNVLLRQNETNNKLSTWKEFSMSKVWMAVLGEVVLTPGSISAETEVHKHS